MSERAHGETAAELRALLDAAVDGIVVINAEGRIIEFNPAAQGLFGYELADVLGKKVDILMPEPYSSNHPDYIDRYLKTREARIIGIGREVEARRADGSVFPVALSVGEVVGGDSTRFIGIIRDLSVQRSAEDEARRLQARLAHVARYQLVGEMAAGLAHEINQPLSAIMTYAQAGKRMLSSGELDVGPLKEACEKITDQADRAGKVIARLRDFMRRQEVRKEPLDINRVVREGLRIIEGDARAEGVLLRGEYATGLPQIMGDSVQIQQVLLNLVRNALDAMADSLRKDEGVTIRTGAKDEESVQVTVADRGHGVSPQLMESIFHPFVTTKREGLGVGLSISRTIIQAHGGDLFCRRNPGGGAVFGFTLPTRGGD